MNSSYETVIGLEIHVELATKSKIFCSCGTEFGAPANTQCCPVCMGLPGALPVLNEKAVEYAVRAGLATNCSISRISSFDRKNYFYPDLPKAYQITQFEHPICTGGYLDISVDGKEKRIGITRIHLEEDAGKLIHEEITKIDHNRCGIPLIEIVTEPCIRSATEAVAFLKELRSVITFSGISKCKMNEGAFRCDVNLSVRKSGDTVMATRTEIKNINSFTFVAQAIEYESKRQIEIYDNGGEVIRETRRFDSAKKKTFSMRKKEGEADYRYFPEPDLPPVTTDDEYVENIRRALPLSPSQRRSIYTEDYGIRQCDCDVLLSDVSVSDYFEACAVPSESPRTSAALIITDLLSFAGNGDPKEKVTPGALSEISNMLYKKEINSTTAKDLLSRVYEDGIDPRDTVENEGLGQITDPTRLSEMISEAISELSEVIEDIRRGKSAASKRIFGRVMAKSNKRADPVLLTSLLEKALSDII